MYEVQYLNHEDRNYSNSDHGHQAHVVADQGVFAAPEMDVELLGLIFIVVVSRVVGDLVLDARSWGAWVAAAEGD